jgi:hypothetical protein
MVKQGMVANASELLRGLKGSWRSTLKVSISD